LARKLEREELKKNRGVQQQRRPQQQGGPHSPGGSYLGNGGGSPDGTMGGTMWRASVINTPSTPMVRTEFHCIICILDFEYLLITTLTLYGEFAIDSD
jgi:hypothetical protein